MEFVRPFDDTKAASPGFPGFRAQFLSHLESAVLMHAVIQPGGSGPGLHYHDVDQIFFVVEGTMTLHLDAEVHTLGAQSLAFIPAGLPHRNGNDAAGVERHLEIFLPTPAPAASLARMLDPGAEVPADARATAPGWTTQVDTARVTELRRGVRVQALADARSGSRHGTVGYVELDPGAEGSGLHVHDGDVYCLVLSGELTVEVALETRVVTEGALVILPAGVPHRVANRGGGVESHLLVTTPAATRGPWEVAVGFGRAT